MNENEIALVKKTWKMFRAVDPSIVGDVFYTRLFTYNPSLRKMFPASMNEQYQKLIEMISIIVSRLERPHEVSHEISALARRHVKYGVRPGHYKLVGKALLWTLQQGLGKDWTPDIEAAWIECYNILSNTMVKASADYMAGQNQ